MSVRRATVFHVCRNHGWLNAESRYRRAEFFAEGGPHGEPYAADAPCKVRPGTDLFCADLCGHREWFGTTSGPFAWAANA